MVSVNMILIFMPACRASPIHGKLCQRAQKPARQEPQEGMGAHPDDWGKIQWTLEPGCISEPACCPEDESVLRPHLERCRLLKHATVIPDGTFWSEDHFSTRSTHRRL